MTNNAAIFAAIQLILVFPTSAEDRPYKKYDSPIDEGRLFELRLRELLPPDAAEYVDHYRNCQHWQGEDGSDEDRRKEIQNGIIANCVDLEQKKKSIQNKHQKESKVLELVASIIKEVDTGEPLPPFLWNDPEKKSALLDEYYEAKGQWVVRQLQKLIPEYQDAAEQLKDHPGDAGYKKVLEGAIFHLDIQKRYLAVVLKNSDRLHPITRDQVKASEKQLNACCSWRPNP